MGCYEQLGAVEHIGATQRGHTEEVLSIKICYQEVSDYTKRVSYNEVYRGYSSERLCAYEEVYHNEVLREN